MEVLSAAERRAREMPVPPAPLEAAADRLRADCVHFFAKAPEPPLYRRADDPARAEAARLVPEVGELYARCRVLEQQASVAAHVEGLTAALRAHLVTLCHTAAGRLEAAEDAWREATALERTAASARRLWVRSDEVLPPVYDARTGVSRYDPRPEPNVRTKLVCVQKGCQKIDEYAFSPRHATHRFECSGCRSPFLAYFAEVRIAQVEARGGQLKHYLFQLAEMGGGFSRLEFDDASGAELAAARGDLLAFLYTEDQTLRGVLNLSTSRILWVSRGGCFVATVAFGRDAAELHAFRAYRDQVLLSNEAGRLLVRAYYLAGPWLAGFVARNPRAHRLVRGMLKRLHDKLTQSGYR